MEKDQKDNKELTYKDCVWYMEDIDRCKLPGARERYMTCMAQEKGEMDELCVWITNFITPTEEVEKPPEIQLELFDLKEPSGGYMENLFKKTYKALIKVYNA